MGVKLTKVAQKVFGASSGLAQIAKFGSLYAGAPATTSPDNAGAAEAQSLSNWMGGWFLAAIGGASPAIEDQNAVDFVFSRQLAYLMQQGVAEWDAATEYFVGSLVNDGGVMYRSLVNENVNHATSDSEYWKMFSSDSVGTLKDFLGSTIPDGYVLASGRTIGSAASGGTERANADTIDLYTMLWNDYSNTILTIQDLTGAPTTRGANAGADFAANKRLPLPDLRGRVTAGKDNMGGTAASRLTGTAVAPNGNTLGAAGGTQTHQLVTGELPTHNHGVNDPGHNHSLNPLQLYSGGGAANGGGSAGGPFLTSSINPTGISIQDTGGNGAHLNTQPTFVVNKIIKL